ncbi:ornithine decarboxylase 2-like isoform X1 [Neodiprion pinetum]|uniref:ornithine decarboxylase 2-like isoform X1 n=1 Tax=Neodiprion pinetum TaxID=441929 RepID=UPI001EE12051|nr:ornithine decarboxylase 2-like [Neodiprion pinetum]
MTFNEVRVIDDIEDYFTYIAEITKSNEQEDAFYVLDVGDVVEQHRKWLSTIPRVEPHFAIKCNPNGTVIKTLAALNAGFDCASKEEISQVLSAGVSGDRIIFANTMKQHSHIKYARMVGVTNLTVDSEEELYKMKNLFPEANIIIRFRCDAAVSQIELGSKSGCDPIIEAPQLVKKTRELGLNLHGFSFHVGSDCGEPMAYGRGIGIAQNLFKYAESHGFQNVKLLDIGGGFPGGDKSIDEIAKIINEALEGVDPSIRVISEPGRYYVASAFTLASFVFGKKTVTEEGKIRNMYWINDGNFGSFIDHLLAIKTYSPIALNKPVCEKKYLSTIWGPTLDPYDCVIRDHWFPELEIGDWLVWPNMGAYTLSLAGTFNGILPPAVFPFIKREALKSLDLEQKMHPKIKSLFGTEENHWDQQSKSTSVTIIQ